MKRIHKLVIGGIQNEIFNLVLLTIIILSKDKFIINMDKNADSVKESG